MGDELKRDEKMKELLSALENRVKSDYEKDEDRDLYGISVNFKALYRKYDYKINVDRAFFYGELRAILREDPKFENLFNMRKCLLIIKLSKKNLVEAIQALQYMFDIPDRWFMQIIGIYDFNFSDFELSL